MLAFRFCGCVVLMLGAAVPVLAAERPVIGGQRDAHGCLAPAGYLWCAAENECVRPWILAADKGFENNSEAFTAYCEPK